VLLVGENTERKEDTGLVKDTSREDYIEIYITFKNNINTKVTFGYI